MPLSNVSTRATLSLVAFTAYRPTASSCVWSKKIKASSAKKSSDALELEGTSSESRARTGLFLDLTARVLAPRGIGVEGAEEKWMFAQESKSDTGLLSEDV